MIHVVMPFSRPGNFAALKAVLEPQRVQWHLIYHEGQPVECLPWAEWYFHRPSGDPCYSKLNYFIEAAHIWPDDWYHFLCDDDLVSPTFYEELWDAIKQADKPALLVSALRGHRDMKYGCGPLIGHVLTAGLDSTGVDQLVIRGDLLKQLHFEQHENADGLMAGKLAKQDLLAYAPKLWVEFNRLEPGRWIEGEPCEMPEIELHDPKTLCVGHVEDFIKPLPRVRPVVVLNADGSVSPARISHGAIDVQGIIMRAVLVQGS